MSDPPGNAGGAEELFEEFLRQRQGGESFQAFVNRFEGQRAALEALHSLWQAGALDPGATRDEPGGVEVRSERLAGALQAFGDQPETEQDLLRRERIPNHKLLEVLGEGGFGTVYRAEQERPVRRTVAIKVVKLGMDTKEVVARFEAERQALALMSHPAIARIYEAGVTLQGRPYFAMEYIQGRPITVWCDEQGLDLEARLQVFGTVCEAIEHAHQKGVIHRDLKPSNVLVSLEGGKPCPKVIDFGIAKATGPELTDTTLRTELGQVIGTPAYMSPEQADLGRVDLDTRSDIYSLGVILHELLVGQPPFDRDAFRQKSFDEILRFIREAEPARPSLCLERAARDRRATDPAAARRLQSRARRLRGDLDWILLKALAKDRNRRYRAVSDLVEDLRRHLASEPVQAGPPGLAYRVAKWTRKHRVRLGVAAALACVAAFVAGAFVARDLRETRTALGEARSAIAARRVHAARAAVSALLRDHYDLAEVQTLAADFSRLELETASSESARQLAAAEAQWSLYRERRDEAERAAAEWTSEHNENPGYLYPWERPRELSLHETKRALARARDDLYDAAIGIYQKAIDEAPRGSLAARTAREALARAYLEVREIARGQERFSFAPEYFLQRAVDLNPSLRAPRTSRVRIRSTPPGATVHCFRFAEHEVRLLPLPYNPRAVAQDPAGGFVRGPSLVVERLTEPGASPFRPGDRLRSIEGQALSVRGDLARALAAGKGAPLRVVVERDSHELVLEWQPQGWGEETAGGRPPQRRGWPGFTLEAQPLELPPEASLGRTSPTAALETDLPDGSYLLVLRREGSLEARLPLVVAGKPGEIDIPLLGVDEVPPDFVYIPPGEFQRGGDPEAFQSQPYGVVDVPGFVIGRFEVTHGEYLEYLNDPEVGVDAAGTVLPTQSAVRSYWASLERRGGRPPERLEVLPHFERGFKVTLEAAGREAASLDTVVFRDGHWELNTRLVDGPRWPVFGVSRFAAEEYAAWRSRRLPPGPLKLLRLPSDDEWEKAARGADRRDYVWGDYPMWCFAWVSQGIPRGGTGRGKLPNDVGYVAEDESVYGVRDLTGSVSEHAIGQPAPRFAYSSTRGGNWFNTDEFYCLTATRNGLLPWLTAHNTGFRLVGQLRQEADR